MKIKNNCRKATIQIETGLWSRISFLQKMELTIHLAGCPQCRIYRQQSRYIKKQAISLLLEAGELNANLDDVFKKELDSIIAGWIENPDNPTLF